VCQRIRPRDTRSRADFVEKLGDSVFEGIRISEVPLHAGNIVGERIVQRDVIVEHERKYCDSLVQAVESQVQLIDNVKRAVCIVADDADKVRAFTDGLNNLGGVVAGTGIVGGVPAANPAPLELIPEKFSDLSVSVRCIAEEEHRLLSGLFFLRSASEGELIRLAEYIGSFARLVPVVLDEDHFFDTVVALHHGNDFIHQRQKNLFRLNFLDAGADDGQCDGLQIEARICGQVK